MNFDLGCGVDEPARLTVRTIMTRGMANDFRYSLEKKSRSGMEEHLRGYYTSVYSGIDVEKPFEVSDDEMRNEIVLTEYYTIRDLWEHEGDSIYGADLYPREVGGCLDTPDSPSPPHHLHPAFLSWCRGGVVISFLLAGIAGRAHRCRRTGACEVFRPGI